MRKFYLNIALLTLFIFVMSFHFIPKILHEILGLILFVSMVYHFFWNWQAFKNLKVRIYQFIDISLFMGLIIIIATGICISNHLFNGMINMKLQRNITIHQLHVSLPFLFMILSGIHLGLHWQGFKQRFKNLINLNLNVPNLLNKIVIAALICIGIYGSFLNRIGDRLMMEHIFATDATNLPFIEFIILMSGIFALYVIIGFVLNKYIK